MQGFPSLLFLDGAGRALPGYVARAADTPALNRLPALQPPVPPYGAPAYAYFQVLGTTRTQDEQLCPASRQDQPASLVVALPGPVQFTVRNIAGDGGSFSSCDGRIQVGPVASASH